MVIPGGVGDGFYGTHFVLHFRRQKYACEIRLGGDRDGYSLILIPHTAKPNPGWGGEKRKSFFFGVPCRVPSLREKVMSKQGAK